MWISVKINYCIFQGERSLVENWCQTGGSEFVSVAGRFGLSSEAKLKAVPVSGDPCSWTYSVRISWRSCSCAPCALTGVVKGPGCWRAEHSLRLLLCHLLWWVKCSTFPHSRHLLPNLYVFHITIYFLCHIYFRLQPFSFHTKWMIRWIALKPYLLGGFLSPLTFRTTLNWAVEQQLPILGLYSHMELTRLPSLAIFLLQISLALSWS